MKHLRRCIAFPLIIVGEVAFELAAWILGDDMDSDWLP